MAFSRYVWPLYHEGFEPDLSVFNKAELSYMKQHGVPPNSGIERNKKRKNVDLALLCVNKETNKIASQLYYSSRVFVFNDARSCLWFLKRIGRVNLSNLNTAVFNFSSGYFLSAENRTEFDICEERLWCAVFQFLKYKHQIQKCVVRFVKLKPLKGRNDLTDDDKIDLTESRQDLVRALSEIRGMKDVVIENQDCEYLGIWERGQIAARMVRSADGMEDGGMTILRDLE